MHWKQAVLTTGLPGNSLSELLYTRQCTEDPKNFCLCGSQLSIFTALEIKTETILKIFVNF